MQVRYLIRFKDGDNVKQLVRFGRDKAHRTFDRLHGPRELARLYNGEETVVRESR